MDFFDAEKFKKAAQKIGTAAQAHAARAAAHASSATSAALKDARKTAANMLNTSPTSQLVGQTINIQGIPYFVESLLAEGGFGSIYKSLRADVAPGEPNPAVVLKRMYAGNPELVKQLTHEIEIMKQLQGHPNIVKMIAFEIRRQSRESAEIDVVMEFCSGGNMFARVNDMQVRKQSLPWDRMLHVFVQVCKAIGEMHRQSPPITHRDIKFENLLISSQGIIRLCDFGSASTFSGVLSTKEERVQQEDEIARFTTPNFRAPEMCDLYNNMPIDARTDVWALGCILYGLAYKSHPFQDAGPLGILACRYKLPTLPEYPACIHAIIRACLQYNPADRPTAATLVKYIEECLKIGASGPFPDLELSGGHSIPTASLKIAPQATEETSDPYAASLNANNGAGTSQSFVWITGVSNSQDSGAGGASSSSSSGGIGSSSGAASHAQPRLYAPSAQDILQQVQQAAAGASAAASKATGALANRLARRTTQGPKPMVAGTPLLPIAKPAERRDPATFSSAAPSPVVSADWNTAEAPTAVPAAVSSPATEAMDALADSFFASVSVQQAVAPAAIPQPSQDSSSLDDFFAFSASDHPEQTVQPIQAPSANSSRACAPSMGVAQPSNDTSFDDFFSSFSSGATAVPAAQKTAPAAPRQDARATSSAVQGNSVASGNFDPFAIAPPTSARVNTAPAADLFGMPIQNQQTAPSTKKSDIDDLFNSFLNSSTTPAVQSANPENAGGSRKQAIDEIFNFL